MSAPALEIAAPLETPVTPPLQLRPIALLTLGHLLVDLCQGLVPALVPFLVVKAGYSYAAAGGLVFATAALSSVVQPLFGRWADKGSIPHLLAWSVMLAGLSLAIGAQVETYPLLLLCFASSGLGIAAFHPEAARRTYLAAGPARTTAMSYFSLGGSIGFALAPMLGAFLLTNFGRTGVLTIIPLALTVSALLGWEFRQPVIPKTSSPGPHDAGVDDWRGFWILSIGVIARSIVFFGLNAFLVLFWAQYWKLELTAGTLALSVFLMSGVGGTLIGGWFADRVGRRRVIQSGFGLAMLCFPLAFVAPSAGLGLILLGLAAAAFFAPSSPAVVLGQEYLPNRVGVASGVTIGLAVSTGGMLTPALGQLGDVAGLATVFFVLECLLAVCFVSTLFLPSVQHTPKK